MRNSILRQWACCLIEFLAFLAKLFLNLIFDVLCYSKAFWIVTRPCRGSEKKELKLTNFIEHPSWMTPRVFGHLYGNLPFTKAKNNQKAFYKIIVSKLIIEVLNLIDDQKSNFPMISIMDLIHIPKMQSALQTAIL